MDGAVDTQTALALAVALAKTSLRSYDDCEPKPGDLVVEVTGLTRADPDAIGWLEGHDMAPYGRDDPTDGSVPMREVWDVRPLSGAKGVNGSDVQRWENAAFVKVPDSVLWQAGLLVAQATSE